MKLKLAAKLCPGKYVGSTDSFSDGFRVAGDHAGPTSSHKAYNPTDDAGKYVGSTDSFSDGFRVQNKGGQPQNQQGDDQQYDDDQ
jgi:hypothetical protein